MQHTLPSRIWGARAFVGVLLLLVGAQSAQAQDARWTTIVRRADGTLLAEEGPDRIVPASTIKLVMAGYVRLAHDTTSPLQSTLECASPCRWSAAGDTLRSAWRVVLSGDPGIQTRDGLMVMAESLAVRTRRRAGSALGTGRIVLAAPGAVVTPDGRLTRSGRFPATWAARHRGTRYAGDGIRWTPRLPPTDVVHLVERGLTDGGVRVARLALVTPSARQWTTLARWASESRDIALRRVLAVSDNRQAEMLLRRSRNDTEDVARVASAWSGVTVRDASGLGSDGPGGAISAHALARWLGTMARTDPALLALTPTAGAPGTTMARWPVVDAAVHLKTGTLDQWSVLAGWVVRATDTVSVVLAVRTTHPARRAALWAHWQAVVVPALRQPALRDLGLPLPRPTMPGERWALDAPVFRRSVLTPPAR